MPSVIFFGSLFKTSRSKNMRYKKNSHGKKVYITHGAKNNTSHNLPLSVQSETITLAVAMFHFSNFSQLNEN